MGNIKFEERAVAFLDILGFKEFIKDAEKVGSYEYTKLCDLQGVIESQIDISSETAGGKGRKFLPEMELKCTYISDSIILSAPISNGSFSGLTVVAMKTIQIAHQLLKMGFLMRGGIAVGLASHTERNIFGTGYQVAYEIQEKHACTPRVLLHKSAADLLDGSGRGESIFSCWVKEDDNWLVNTLYPHWSYIGGRSQCPNELFLGYRKTIIENLNKHPLGSSIRGKWEWMAGYLNETVKRCSDIQRVESIDLSFPPSPFRSGVAADENNPHDVWESFKAPSITGIIKA
jgi:hypothetical protein